MTKRMKTFFAFFHQNLKVKHLKDALEAFITPLFLWVNNTCSSKC